MTSVGEVEPPEDHDELDMWVIRYIGSENEGKRKVMAYCMEHIVSLWPEDGITVLITVHTSQGVRRHTEFVSRAIVTLDGYIVWMREEGIRREEREQALARQWEDIRQNIMQPQAIVVSQAMAGQMKKANPNAGVWLKDLF